MGEGKPSSEAKANVPQSTINDAEQWNTGTPKDTGDAVTQGIYPDASDKNAHAGETTSIAQQAASTSDPRPADQGGTPLSSNNPSTFGSLQDGLPASGAATAPDKTADKDKA